jgi:dienelactone hydrolase
MTKVESTPERQMPAYLAGAGRWPDVAVAHDFTGLSHDLRNQADWLAGEGDMAGPLTLSLPDGRNKGADVTQPGDVCR